MSVLSKLTGIGINPLKGQVKIRTPDPIGAIKDVAQNPLPLLGALAIPGIGGALGAIPGLGGAVKGLGALGALGGGSASSNAIPDAALGIEGDGGGLGGLVGRAGDFLKGNGGRNALGILQGLNAANEQRKANDLAKSALRGAEGMYAERAPLRAAGMQGLLNPQTPDLAPLRATTYTGNPYAMGGT